MRIAVLLVGHVRTWEKTILSFKNKFNPVNGQNTYDFFINTYDIKYGYHPHIRGCLNYWEDEFTSLNEETKAMCKSIVIETEDQFDDEMKDVKIRYFKIFIHFIYI